ncbi:MAG: galactonate dehydratase [Chloroflexota bacterium]
MKITRIETLPAPMGYRDFLVCRVHTDEGITGIGEPYPAGPNDAVAAVIADFATWLEGKDPRDITGIWQHLYAHSRFPGGSVVLAAISGIEHALWDISGKAAGLPVYRLLGGKCRDRIRVYQSCGGSTPEACAESAVRLVETYGYTALKMSPHPPHAEALPWPAVVRGAAARLAAVRDAVGPDVEIGLDPHARIFEPVKAQQMAEALRPYNPFFFEEPLRPENVEALAVFKRTCPIPVATGEMLYTTFGFRELLEKQAADIIQPDVCICGGLLEMKKIAAIAEAHYISVAPHNPTGPIATAVNVHFAASTHNFLILEYHPDDAGPRADLLQRPVQLKDGYLEVPEAPGLGADLSEAAIPDRPIRNWRRGAPLRPDGAADFI